MNPSPTLDVSRPSRLRVAGFLVVVAGALLAGIGATLTWVTVGIEVAQGIDTETKGVDVWEGIVVLACAAVMLVGVLVTRMAASPGVRRSAAAFVIAAGFVTFAVSAAFVMTASTRFQPVEDDTLVSAIAGATGIPDEEVRTTLEGAVEDLGPFTRVGPGPYLAIAGGVAAVVGGILVLAWISRPDETPVADGTLEQTQDGSPRGTDGD